MKEIKQISFTGFILIPAKSRFEGLLPLSYCLKDPIVSSNGEGGLSNVYVMLFNCENAEDILPLVNLEIEKVNKEIEINSDKKILITQLKFFSDLKKEIEDIKLHNCAPEEILNILSKAGLSGLKKEGVIFLSGVSSLVEE
jgi:hypothetical protein